MKKLFMVLGILLATTMALAQGRPVCDSIFPPPEMVPAGEEMTGERVQLIEFGLFVMVLERDSNKIYWSFASSTKVSVFNPEYWINAPFWWEFSYQAYCRHQGHADSCTTSCLTFNGESVDYTVFMAYDEDWTLVEWKATN